MASPDPQPRLPRRNWFSFSLRSLLIVTTLICAPTETVRVGIVLTEF